MPEPSAPQVEQEACTLVDDDCCSSIVTTGTNDAAIIHFEPIKIRLDVFHVIKRLNKKITTNTNN